MGLTRETLFKELARVPASHAKALLRELPEIPCLEYKCPDESLLGPRLLDLGISQRIRADGNVARVRYAVYLEEIKAAAKRLGIFRRCRWVMSGKYKE